MLALEGSAGEGHRGCPGGSGGPKASQAGPRLPKARGGMAVAQNPVVL